MHSRQIYVPDMRHTHRDELTGTGILGFANSRHALLQFDNQYYGRDLSFWNHSSIQRADCV